MLNTISASNANAMKPTANGPDSSAREVRRRGRRRQFDGPPVSVRLPRDLYDALTREAQESRKDLAVVIRKGLRNFVSQKLTKGNRQAESDTNIT